VYLGASFPKPEQFAFGIYYGFYSMTFQVVSYALSRKLMAYDPNTRWPTGRHYNDGPYIRLGVLSVRKLE